MRVCQKLVETANADFLRGCQVGGSRKGFLEEDFREVLHHLCVGFGRDMIGHSVIDNHVTLWDFGAASQGSGNSSQPARVTCGANRQGIEITPGVDAAVCAFDVETAAGARCRLVVGNMQIVCGDHPLEIWERQQVVKRLADILLNYKSARDPPVVRVIVGDNAMPSFEVRKALQQVTQTDPVWNVVASAHDRPGDNVAVKAPQRNSRPSMLASPTMILGCAGTIMMLSRS